MAAVIEVRLRTAAHPDDLEAMKGKLVTSSAFDLLLTGPCKVLKPNGDPLCVYLPRDLCSVMGDAYDVLHMLRNERTDNRGLASGTERMTRGDQKRTRSSLVPSAIIGAVDPGGIYPFCRLTSWTGQHLDEWHSLAPLLQAMDAALRTHVRERWVKQYRVAASIHPEWVIPGTTFTTVTVNTSYSTGCHADSGDLESGFSTLAVARRGDYTGGEFVIPKYRVAIDMQDGDLLLLDAHELHGNTVMHMHSDDAARCSVVAYLRTRMTRCGTADEEQAKAQAYAAKRTGRVLEHG